MDRPPLRPEVVLGGAAAVALVVGSFLPWLRVGGSPLLGSSATTTSGIARSDGWLTVGAGVLLFLYARHWMRTLPAFDDWRAPALVSGLVAAVLAYEYVDIHRDASRMSIIFDVSYGPGLHLCAAGAVAGVAMAYLRRRRTRAPRY